MRHINAAIAIAVIVLALSGPLSAQTAHHGRPVPLPPAPTGTTPEVPKIRVLINAAKLVVIDPAKPPSLEATAPFDEVDELILITEGTSRGPLSSIASERNRCGNQDVTRVKFSEVSDGKPAGRTFFGYMTSCSQNLVVVGMPPQMASVTEDGQYLPPLQGSVLAMQVVTNGVESAPVLFPVNRIQQGVDPTYAVRH